VRAERKEKKQNARVSCTRKESYHTSGVVGDEFVNDRADE